jgi:hypothetical protein
VVVYRVSASAHDQFFERHFAFLPTNSGVQTRS